ncbi:MAG: 3-dehydroquinate synthase [Candidatus Omnitrophica bacterium]|nr:3-dehydroquinate synthase [Candidatus Omnitrophota bacterium]
MTTIRVKSLKHRYEIKIGSGLLERSGEFFKALDFKGKVLIVTQRAVASRFLSRLTDGLAQEGYPCEVLYVPDGEKAKSLESLAKVYDQLIRRDFERRDVVAALGGGVVGDLAGFAASTYLRGLAFVNFGTTLLAQVDSSIGGKTAVNHRHGKNLVGTFYPPRLVVSDIGTLATLPKRELCASLAEVVKYGMIRDRQLFKTLERQSAKILQRDEELLQELVVRSASIKAEVVSRDEFEIKGERMILNYGHTFGHAFEKAAGYEKLAHGEAVSIGMVCAARLAVSLKILEPSVEKRQTQVLQALGLPVKLSGGAYRIPAILEAMMRDKKKRGGKLRFILPEKIGCVTVLENIPVQALKPVLKEAGAV